MGCFSGCLMFSTGIQKLFCGIYSAFKCSFDEFLWGEKVVSPSYSSAILGPPPILVLNFCFSIGFNCIYLPPGKASFFIIFYMLQKHFFILYVYIYLSLMIVLSLYFMYRYTHKPVHVYI